MQISFIRSLVCISALASITGCATSKLINGPNGLPAHSIACGVINPEACLEKAGEVCPTGYTVLSSRAGQNLGQFETGSLNAGWNKFGGSISGASNSSPVFSPNTMLIQCKTPQGRVEQRR